MHDLGLISTLAASFTVALVLGFITQHLGLSPILGYLLAGIAVGPHTPGFIADSAAAGQLAEVGVVLLMFGVGLNFHLKDLLAVRSIAVPGAVGQSLIATALAVGVAMFFGMSFSAGLVLGMAVSVASTVVLIRVLTDNDLLSLPRGHIAVGWLVVEDLFTVFALVLLPPLAGPRAGDAGAQHGLLWTLGWTTLKLAALSVLMLYAGNRAIPWFLKQIARSRSRELFTLAVLVLALGIATGASAIFGVSMALGAFLAGMAVGQSPLSYQAAADALPMRDAFAVLFFVSVGMLFDPAFVLKEPGLVLGILAVVLLAKPLAALIIVVTLGYSVQTALTVAIGLAQIGEFSFILADSARKLDLLPEAGGSVLVACALLSIGINPLLFRALGPCERWLRRRESLWRMLNHRADLKGKEVNLKLGKTLADASGGCRAIVVGYGPVGRTVTRILNDFKIQHVVIDLNVDTILALSRSGYPAIYGDAARREILESARISETRYLLITIPDPAARLSIINAARALNADLRIFVRARYLAERGALDVQGANAVCFEEAEAAVSLAELLLREIGATGENIREEAERIRAELAIQDPTAGGKTPPQGGSASPS